MPTPKTKPTQSASEPKTAPAAAQPPSTPDEQPGLAALLLECFKFDNDASGKERQLLLDTLQYWRREGYPFRVVLADSGLAALGVHVGVDRLEDEAFIELLKLFDAAVSGRGYRGFRDIIITSLLKLGHSEMSFEEVLRIVAIEFEDLHSKIRGAEAALKDYPEDLAEAIEKAIESTPVLRERINAKMRGLL